MQIFCSINHTCAAPLLVISLARKLFSTCGKQLILVVLKPPTLTSVLTLSRLQRGSRYMLGGNMCRIYGGVGGRREARGQGGSSSCREEQREAQFAGSGRHERRLSVPPSQTPAASAELRTRESCHCCTCHAPWNISV